MRAGAAAEAGDAIGGPRTVLRQPVLLTERLRLRPLTDLDRPILRALYTERSVTRFLQNGPYGPWKGRRIAGRMLKIGLQQLRLMGYGPLVIERQGEPGPIGMMALSAIPVLGAERIELSYMLLPGAWGHGLATEAGRVVLADGFDRLGLKQIWATCQTDNAKSLRVLEKLGFEVADRIEAYGHRLPLFILARASAP